MTGKEALEEMKKVSMGPCSDIYSRCCYECNIIEEDLERLEKLEKVIEILKDKFKFELGVSVVKEKYYYLLKFLYNYQYFTITQEEFELLKGWLLNE